MDEKLISIAMATYNGEKYIKKQLQSIFKQDYQNYELIISDDCSTDSTISIIKDFIKQNKNITLIQNSKNLGFKKNFQIAITHCKGEYIALCDQDDIWENNHLSKLLNNIKNKNISCSNSILIDKNDKKQNILMNQVLHLQSLPKDNNDLFTYLLFGNNFIQGSTCLIEANFLKKCLPIPEEINYHDRWFAIQASLNNGINYTFDPTLNYRQHDTNITYNANSIINNLKYIFINKNKYKQDNKNTIKLCYDFLKKDLPQTYKKSIHIILNYYESITKPLCIKWIYYYTKHYKLFYNQSTYNLYFQRLIIKLLLRY